MHYKLPKSRFFFLSYTQHISKPYTHIHTKNHTHTHQQAPHKSVLHSDSNLDPSLAGLFPAPKKQGTLQFAHAFDAQNDYPVSNY